MHRKLFTPYKVDCNCNTSLTLFLISVSASSFDGTVASLKVGAHGINLMRRDQADGNEHGSVAWEVGVYCQVWSWLVKSQEQLTSAGVAFMLEPTI